MCSTIFVPLDNSNFKFLKVWSSFIYSRIIAKEKKVDGFVVAESPSISIGISCFYLPIYFETLFNIIYFVR